MSPIWRLKQHHMGLILCIWRHRVLLWFCSRWSTWLVTLKTWWCPTTSSTALSGPWATGEPSRSSAGALWMTSVSMDWDVPCLVTLIWFQVSEHLYCYVSVSSCSCISLSFSLVVGYGSWFEHVQEFWEHRMDSNVLFLKYEDMYKVTSLVCFFLNICLLALVLIVCNHKW